MGPRTQAHRAQSAQLAERVLRCLGAATFEMETLVRLAGLEVSRDVPSAAVECTGRPRMLLNPDFVERHCRRDEHLLLLVLHELWHVILGHTRLYPRVTPAHNIAFDAVINAGLARQLTAPQYRGFLEALNPADEFPALLLRPPVGWPENPRYPSPDPCGSRSVLERLYPPVTKSSAAMPTYEEIIALIQRIVGMDGCSPNLLGAHDPEGIAAEERAMKDELFGDVVRRMVAAWPPPPIPLAGRDAGGNLVDWAGRPTPAYDALRRAFTRVLLRALGPRPGTRRRRARVEIPLPAGRGVVPNAADRTLAARRLLGLPLTLHDQVTLTMVRAPERPAQAHVYVDVSGSMYSFLPHVTGLLAPYLASGEVRLFQFSTVVEPLPLAELKKGQLRTTGGTDIRCVLEHALAVPRLGRALILTDGYVGPATADQVKRLRAARLRLHAALPAESAYARDLEPIVESLTVLPPFMAARRAA